MATTILIVIAAVAAGVGWLLLRWQREQERKLDLIRQTETVNAASVAGRAPGELVEVKGILRCEAPLTGELSQQPCAYYSSNVTREYEEREQDSDGDWRTVERSQNVASNSRCTAFVVEDESGSVPVNPENAEIDAVTVLDRFEQGQPNGPSISLGGMVINLGGGTSNTLGYRYTESILPLDTQVYVLGVVGPNGEIAAPPSGDRTKKFLISHRSEDALEQSTGSTARWLKVAAYACFALAGVLVVVALVVLRR